MKILKSLVHETIEENTAVTVGKFDGIHKGHELLTQKLREQKKEGLASCVLTFDVSPRIRLEKDMTKLLITNAEREHIFEAEEKEYIALLPLDENGDNTDGQIYLYRFIDNGEEEEPGLENIEEDEEFDRVSAIFNEWLDTQDFGDIDLDALDDLED